MRTLLSWSSGKDSAWALHVLQQDPAIELAGLVTTINAAFDRVAMHGVRRELVEAQASAAGLPLHLLPIPYPCPNEEYERVMGTFVAGQVAQGIEAIAFGDLFLEDIRRYRENRLAGSGMRPLFPLWGRETGKLARTMVDGGLEAYVSCVDPRKLPASFAGRRFDAQLLADLPGGIDPCAENGEFHSFASAGPMFRSRIPVEVGETVTRDGFVFCDLMPAQTPNSQRTLEGTGRHAEGAPSASQAG
jgi:uncharacterized protein (TIGR00290 family)